MPETVPLLDELEDASKRGVLFGIIISSQHEVHRSVTVHILHGTQQGKFCSHVNCTWANVCSHMINIVIQCMNDTQKLFRMNILWKSSNFAESSKNFPVVSELTLLLGSCYPLFWTKNANLE